MSKLRFRVVESAFEKKATELTTPAERPSEYYGELVFNREKMFKYLPERAYERLVDSIDNGTPLDRETANAVASGMKKWAMEKGATHYTHWFHPLTEGTAEKHDAFIEHDGKGGVLEEFEGKLLIQQEPDASSFPNGGIRNTFEARGYSAWDPSSPAFIVGDTLCIPTIFIAYTGESLDYKAPLLKALEAVNKAAVDVCHYFNPDVKKVYAYLGWEQEYFLVDEGLYAARPDLLMTGRTLMGHESSKNQQLEDHYFGAIRPRVAAYMQDLDRELWKLGVLSKTKHNEVAPSQHEMAPIYCDCNAANDQNQLTMEVMKKVADRHGLVCLLHEKPFAGVNGSGKHNNWSLGTDTGKNLFSPGKTPSQNAQFLLFLAAFVAGVDEYQELLRSTVAFAGNDHRLGAQEAPPAVISIFLGTELEDIIDSIVSEQDYTEKTGRQLRIGVDVLPTIPQDTTDRNRTSPLAFTGNKFEFRMPGSSQSIAGPNTILNTIMAEELGRFADRLTGAADFQQALNILLREVFQRHRRIIFGGNGYDSAWMAEAERRGLVNLPNTAAALPAYILPKNVALMTKHGVYTTSEMMARHEIHMEKYCKLISIEAATLVDMVQHSILHAASRYEGVLCQTILQKKQALPHADCRVETALAESILTLNGELLDDTVALKTALETAPETDGEHMLRYYHDTIFAQMNKVRASIDKLETLVAGDYWPYPRYTDLLFSV